MNNLISLLIRDFPGVAFTRGDDFHWSPRENAVTYQPHMITSTSGQWTLLHELGHALLKHQSYHSDLELVQMEVAAWEKAKQLATTYQLSISEDYIQNCLDSYRDWLHLRSKCPRCGINCHQSDSRHYKCHNCSHTWNVSSSRFCRPYRRSKNKKTSPAQTEKAMFL